MLFRFEMHTKYDITFCQRETRPILHDIPNQVWKGTKLRADYGICIGVYSTRYMYLNYVDVYAYE